MMDKTTFLFNYGTTKAEDSYILDYIHGNSLIFGNKRERHLNEDNKCYFCQTHYDNRHHQLFECEEVQDETHKAFKEKLGCERNDLVEVLGSKRSEGKHITFVERVKFLKGQHEFLIEELKNLKSCKRRGQNQLTTQQA